MGTPTNAELRQKRCQTRLRPLDDENVKLKRLLTDAMLDNAALKDLLGKILMASWRSVAAHLEEQQGMSEQRECRVIDADRKSVCHQSGRLLETSCVPACAGTLDVHDFNSWDWAITTMTSFAQRL